MFYPSMFNILLMFHQILTPALSFTSPVVGWRSDSHAPWPCVRLVKGVFGFMLFSLRVQANVMIRAFVKMKKSKN